MRYYLCVHVYLQLDCELYESRNQILLISVSFLEKPLTYNRSLKKYLMNEWVNKCSAIIIEMYF